MSGVVMAWGSNETGQLGNGTQPPDTREYGKEYDNEYNATPELISGLTGVTTIVGRANSADAASIFALRDDGSVWAWGLNHVGQLGDGTTHTIRRTPVRVAGLADVAAIACEPHSGYALRGDGSLWAWGCHPAKDDGDVLMPNRPVPGPMVGFSTMQSFATSSWLGVVSVYGLAADGTVWAWGDNTAGQLGDGSTKTPPWMGQVNGLSGITSISADHRVAYAVGVDGAVWAWGENDSGQLGDGTRERRTTPVRVPGIPPITRVHPIHQGAYAIAKDGSLWAWGSNTTALGSAPGVLGVGHAGKSLPTPRRVELPLAITDLSSGAGSTFALGVDGHVWAWGVNQRGRLGLGHSEDDLTAVQPTPSQLHDLSDVVQVSTARTSAAPSAFAVRSDGSLWSWGSGWRGQMGRGDTADGATPRQVPDVSDVKSVSAVGAAVFAIVG